MKLTDALARNLKKKGVSHVFGLQGGAVVHIFDSLEENGVGVTYMHHEESAALAAAAYAKVTGELGCVVVTTGPGSTNAITGLLASWQDSIPCIFISGQARSQHTSYGRKVRQVGTQEVNICDIVAPITKLAKFVTNKDNFVFELDQAIDIARSGRPGPVWLDLAIDVQWADISFDENTKKEVIKDKEVEAYLDIGSASESLKLLNQSEKPLLIIGYGIRLADCADSLYKLIEKHNVPFVTTWTASDLFPTAHPLNLGIIGMCGQRGANRAVFDCDLFVCLGTHLSIPHTTTLFGSYAPQAKKVIVNIDGDQLDNLNVKFDLKILGDVAKYIKWLSKEDIKEISWPYISVFKEQNWYSPKLTQSPNSNVYVRELTKQATGKTCLVVDGGGTALYAGFQSSILKSGDRIICASAISAMGTGLAETVGVSKLKEFSRILCIIGDGSFLMNIQDLQSIRQDNINVVISVINNNGYLAIRNTQNEFLEGRLYGTHPEWELTLPSIKKIATAFDIPFVRLDAAKDIKQVISRLSKERGPIICEVVVDENQDVLFKQGFLDNGDGNFSPQPLSEMAPFL